MKVRVRKERGEEGSKRGMVEERGEKESGKGEGLEKRGRKEDEIN